MKTVNIGEAKTHLSRLLTEAAAGADIVIARAGRPIARLVPVGSGDSSPTGDGDSGKSAEGNVEGPRVAGRDRGLFKVPDNFNDPLPDDFMAFFE